MDKETGTEAKSIIQPWAISFAIVLFSAALCYRLATSQFNLDTPTLLSILLAFFSIALSVGFYFKADESSTRFYDNSYRFTKDIAELLVKIESSFGEKLNHIRSSHDSIDQYIRQQSGSQHTLEKLAEATTALGEAKEKFQEGLSEQEKIFENLLTRANLKEAEKAEIAKEFHLKREEIKSSLDSTDEIKDKIQIIKNNRNALSLVRNYTVGSLMKKLSPDFIIESTHSELASAFERIKSRLNRYFLEDLEELGFYNNESLTNEGYSFFQKVAMDRIRKNNNET